MSEKIHVAIEGLQAVLVYLAASFGGGIGGAAVAANKHVQTRSLMAFSVIALVILGVFSGLAVASYLLSGFPLFGLSSPTSFHEVFFWSLIGGFSGAILIGGANLSAGVIAVYIMKRMGLPVELVKKDDSQGLGR